MCHSYGVEDERHWWTEILIVIVFSLILGTIVGGGIFGLKACSDAEYAAQPYKRYRLLSGEEVKCKGIECIQGCCRLMNCAEDVHVRCATNVVELTN